MTFSFFDFGRPEEEVEDGSPRQGIDATLCVQNNVSLTLAGESLVVAGWAASKDHGFEQTPTRSCCDFILAPSTHYLLPSILVHYVGERRQLHTRRTTPVFHPLVPDQKTSLYFAEAQNPRRLSIPYFNILWAEAIDGFLAINYAKPNSKTDVVLATLSYAIDQQHNSATETWVETLLSISYGEAQRKKRIKVLINPFGGKGNARRNFFKDVEPIFVAANCHIDAVMTEYQGHAVDIAENIDIDAWDVMAACSGDGVLCEIFNGLGKKENASEALGKIAVAHIPCGSGNAMSWNLYGSGSPSMAALCTIKGLRTPLDLVSITQGPRRTLSFLSQAFGIVADSDLGTDNLRWMGAARFTYGFLVRLFGNTVYPCELAVKVELDDKKLIKEHYSAIVRDKSASEPCGEPPRHKGLPPLQYGVATDPIPSDWELISHDKLGNFYAGNMAFMAQDANFFPAALPNDGYLDLITIRGDVSRFVALQMLKALDNGTLFDMPDVRVQKISGYRITPKDRDEGYISIDGEKVPFEPFQAEVHQGLGTVISKSGYKYEI
ncbi:sphinganine kinase lcb4 [Myotisia sp. PD_48]|nr:sphinganine kinase lcb4 [Myotisia sp. PD_48]